MDDLDLDSDDDALFDLPITRTPAPCQQPIRIANAAAAGVWPGSNLNQPSTHAPSSFAPPNCIEASAQRVYGHYNEPQLPQGAPALVKAQQQYRFNGPAQTNTADPAVSASAHLQNSFQGLCSGSAPSRWPGTSTAPAFMQNSHTGCTSIPQGNTAPFAANIAQQIPTYAAAGQGQHFPAAHVPYGQQNPPPVLHAAAQVNNQQAAPYSTPHGAFPAAQQPILQPQVPHAHAQAPQPAPLETREANAAPAQLSTHANCSNTHSLIHTSEPTPNPSNLPITEDWTHKEPAVPKLPLSQVHSGNTAVPIAHTHMARWVYPTNKPVREYQLSITQSGLFDNTLVCLPTGLGKTLIAAVIMCNFYRWFPTGKVIFVAPTRPLVDQQMGACFSITDIARDHTVQLTGQTMPPADRKKAWDSCRVFFCTPQVLDNDVSKGLCPANKVVCLIVDECHRAVGNAPVVNALRGIHTTRGAALRVIGLSATPGSQPEKIQEVIKNLRISRVRFYSHQHAEVKLYRHRISEDVRTVKAQGDLSGCMQSLRDILYNLLAKLVKLGAYSHCNVDQASAFSLDGAMKTYHAQTSNTVSKCKSFRETQCTVYKEFKRATFCARLLSQLSENGASYAADYAHQMLGNPKDAPLRNFPIDYPCFGQFRNHLESLKRLGAGEPKVEELTRVLKEHYACEENAPRLGTAAGAVMVFTSMRNAVNDICGRLNDLQGVNIKARKFVGQVATKKGTSGDNTGMTQKDQKAVIQDFRKGLFNVLVATCIGEEGLDIPDVDLIVCLDVSSSPTRSVQRMGRTGRHRAGRVVYILSEGAEQEKYRKGQQTTERLHGMLEDAPAHFKLQPRSKILPEGYQPEKLCYKFAVTDPPAPLTKESTPATTDDALDGNSSKAGMTFMSRILAERNTAEAPSAAHQNALARSRGSSCEGSRENSRSQSGAGGTGGQEASMWGRFTREGKSRHGFAAPPPTATTCVSRSKIDRPQADDGSGSRPVQVKMENPSDHLMHAQKSPHKAREAHDATCIDDHQQQLAALGLSPDAQGLRPGHVSGHQPHVMEAQPHVEVPREYQKRLPGDFPGHVHVMDAQLPPHSAAHHAPEQPVQLQQQQQQEVNAANFRGQSACLIDDDDDDEESRRIRAAEHRLGLVSELRNTKSLPGERYDGADQNQICVNSEDELCGMDLEAAHAEEGYCDPFEGNDAAVQDGVDSDDCCVIEEPSVPAGSGSFRNTASPHNSNHAQQHSHSRPGSTGHRTQSPPTHHSGSFKASLPLSERVKAAKAKVASANSSGAQKEPIEGLNSHQLDARDNTFKDMCVGGHSEAQMLNQRYKSSAGNANSPAIAHAPSHVMTMDDYDLPPLPGPGAAAKKAKKVKKSRLPAPKRLPKGEMTTAGRPAIEHALNAEWLEEWPLAWRGLYQWSCLRYGARPAPAAVRAAMNDAKGAPHAAKTSAVPFSIDSDSEARFVHRAHTENAPAHVNTHRSTPNSPAEGNGGGVQDVNMHFEAPNSDSSKPQCTKKKIKTEMLLNHLRGQKQQAEARMQQKRKQTENHKEAETGSTPPSPCAKPSAPPVSAQVEALIFASEALEFATRGGNDDDEENVPLVARGKAIAKADNQPLAARGKTLAARNSNDPALPIQQSPEPEFHASVATSAGAGHSAGTGAKSGSNALQVSDIFQGSPAPAEPQHITGTAQQVIATLQHLSDQRTEAGARPISVGPVDQPFANSGGSSCAQQTAAQHMVQHPAHTAGSAPLRGHAAVPPVQAPGSHTAATPFQNHMVLGKTPTNFSSTSPTGNNCNHPANMAPAFNANSNGNAMHAPHAYQKPSEESPDGVKRATLHDTSTHVHPLSATSPQPVLSLLKSHKRARSVSPLPCSIAPVDRTGAYQYPQAPNAQPQPVSPKLWPAQVAACAPAHIRQFKSPCGNGSNADSSAGRNAQPLFPQLPQGGGIAGAAAQYRSSSGGVCMSGMHTAAHQHAPLQVYKHNRNAAMHSPPPPAQVPPAGPTLCSDMFACASGAPWPKSPSCGGRPTAQHNNQFRAPHGRQCMPGMHSASMELGPQHPVQEPGVGTAQAKLQNTSANAARPQCSGAQVQGTTTSERCRSPSNNACATDTHAPAAPPQPPTQLFSEAAAEPNESQGALQMFQCSPSMRMWARGAPADKRGQHNSDNSNIHGNINSHAQALLGRPVFTQSPGRLGLGFPSGALQDVETIKETSSEDESDDNRNDAENDALCQPDLSLPAQQVTRTPVLQPPANQSTTTVPCVPDTNGVQLQPQQQQQNAGGGHGVSVNDVVNLCANAVTHSQSDSEPEPEEGMAAFRGSTPRSCANKGPPLSTKGKTPHQQPNKGNVPPVPDAEALTAGTVSPRAAPPARCTTTNTTLSDISNSHPRFTGHTLHHNHNVHHATNSHQVHTGITTPQDTKPLNPAPPNISTAGPSELQHAGIMNKTSTKSPTEAAAQASKVAVKAVKGPVVCKSKVLAKRGSAKRRGGDDDDENDELRSIAPKKRAANSTSSSGMLPRAPPKLNPAARR